MIEHPFRFIRARPRGHRSNDERQGLFAGVPELKVYVCRNGHANTCSHRIYDLIVFELSPHFPLPLQEIPNFFNRAVGHRSTRAAR